MATPDAGAAVMEHCVAFAVARLTVTGPPLAGKATAGPVKAVIVGFGGVEPAPT
jgi:hypothetical protein